MTITDLREVVNHWEAMMYCVDFTLQQEPGYVASDFLSDADGLRELALRDYPSEGRRMCMAWSVRARIAA
ncbi:MAG: hypothetical protein ACREX4_11150 [Gammaproteobacteria bacterium]